jgi:protein PhnA
MNTDQMLKQRSNSTCELCTSENNLLAHDIPPNADQSAERSILLCEQCRHQIDNPDKIDANHWRCLNDSMWSQIPAVQVMAWRQLTQLSSETWAQDLLEMLYLDDETLEWAKSVELGADTENSATVDSNGATLAGGDTVTLIKDLVVKGAGFTAKRGTAVRNISLTSNPSQIEGKVNGTRIVLLTEFLKKSN